MNIRIKAVFLLALCAALLFAGCTQSVPAANPTPEPAQTQTPAPTAAPSPVPENQGQGVTVTLIDLKSRQVQVAGAPERIAALSPAVTEILFALNAGDKLVAIDESVEFPPEVFAVSGRFSASAPDIGALKALEPDIVFAGAETPTEIAEQLEAAGMRVVYAEAESYAQVYAAIALVAQITGTNAAALIEKMQNEALEVSAAAADIEPLRTCYLSSYDEEGCVVAGSASLVNALIQMAGGEVVTDELDDAWAEISYEALMNLDPDMLLVSDDIDVDVMLRDAAFADIRAALNGQVYSADEALISIAGPRITEGLRLVQDTLAQALVS